MAHYSSRSSDITVVNIWIQALDSDLPGFGFGFGFRLWIQTYLDLKPSFVSYKFCDL